MAVRRSRRAIAHGGRADRKHAGSNGRASCCRTVVGKAKCPTGGGGFLMVAANSLRVVLYEGAGAAPLEHARRFEITRTLLEKGYGVTRCRAGGKVSDAAASGTLLV